MKKPECERVIRHLTHQWAQETGVQVGSAEMPSFTAFVRWAEAHGHAEAFAFRSREGASDAAERWFDQELKQTWRN